MSAGPPLDLDALAAASTARVRAVLAARRRLDGLDPHGVADDPGPGAAREDRRQLVLRMLRTAGDPVHYALLAAMADGSRTGPELAKLAHLGPVALWEAVGDLVQVGLAERDPTRDAVSLTAAGTALLALIDSVVERGDER